MVRAGLKAIYLSGWQVAADANLAGADLPRPEPLPVEQRAGARRADSTTRCCAPTRSSTPRARDDTRLARADRRRRRGRLRRAAQRVRADEVDDRGGRRRRALRGPALVREEVRPPRRQGARADQPVHPHAGRGAARRRRPRRADRARRPHRRALARRCSPATSTARPRVHHRRAHAPKASSASATASTRRSRAASPTRRTPTCSGSRPRRPTSARRASSRRRSTSVPGQAARLQLLAVVQLEPPPRRRRDRELPAGPRRARLPLPVHHARRLPRAQPSMFELAQRLPRGA